MQRLIKSCAPLAPVLESLENRCLLASVLSEGFFAVVDAAETLFFIGVGIDFSSSIYDDCYSYKGHDKKNVENVMRTWAAFGVLGSISGLMIKSLVHTAVECSVSWVWETFIPMALSSEVRQANQWMGILESSHQVDEEFFAMKETLPQTTYFQGLHSIIMHSVSLAHQIQAAEQFLELKQNSSEEETPTLEWTRLLDIVSQMHAIAECPIGEDSLKSRALDAMERAANLMHDEISKERVRIATQKKLERASSTEPSIEGVLQHSPYVTAEKQIPARPLEEPVVLSKTRGSLVLGFINTLSESSETAAFVFMGVAGVAYLRGKISFQDPWWTIRNEIKEAMIPGAVVGLLLKPLRNHALSYVGAWMFPAALSDQEQVAQQLHILERSDQAVQGLFGLKGKVPDIYYLRGLSSILAHCANPVIQLKAAKEILDLNPGLEVNFFARDFCSIPTPMQSILSSFGCNASSGPSGAACYEALQAAALQWSKNSSKKECAVKL